MGIAVWRYLSARVCTWDGISLQDPQSHRTATHGEMVLCTHWHIQHMQHIQCLMFPFSCSVCRHGSWECTNEGCPGTVRTTVLYVLTAGISRAGLLIFGSVCLLPCCLHVGECLVVGQSHFKTFDHKFFTLTGHCQYLLARDCTDGEFSIIIENVQVL